MKQAFLLSAVLVGLTWISPARAGTQIESSKEATPTEPEPEKPWRFSLQVPGWIPWETGKLGINGQTTHVKEGPNDIVPKADMLLSVRASFGYKKFGVMAEYSYLDISDGVGADGLVKKLDTRTDQHMGELALSWRLVEGQRGWMEGFAGVRYTNLFQQVGLHPDDGAIDEASERIVNTITDRLVAAVKAELATVVQQRVTTELAGLSNRTPTIPQGPIGDAIRTALATKVQALLKQRQAELNGAIKSGVQARINAAKDKLSHDLARTIKDGLNTRVSRTDDWWDPFVGLRGRYYLSKAVYLTARADVGGFGAGSDISWQINAGLGLQLTRNIFSETTYRLYYDNYRRDGLIYDVLTHGFELSLGVNF